MIHNVFSVPIYHSVVDSNLLSNEIENVISRAEFRNDWQPDNDTAHTTFVPNKETNIIKRFSMNNIGSCVLAHANQYLKETKQPYVDKSLSIEQSWINIFKDQDLIGIHEHGYQPNTLSGVYYHKAPNGCGRISFKSPNPFVISFPHQSEDYFNLFNVEPEEGLILLFPSWLLHKVEPNRCGEPRCSLAFNISFDYTFYRNQ